MIKLKSLYNNIDSFINNLQESNDISTWKYWWMSPDLKLYPVTKQGHAKFAKDFLSKINIKCDSNLCSTEPYQVMYKLGWIRLGLAPYMGKNILSYNYSLNNPLTAKQKKAIKDFALEIEADEIRDSTAGKWEYIDETMKYPLAKGKDIQSYAGQENWKGKVVWMSPDKFLKLAAPLPEHLINQDTLNKLEKRFKEQLPVDYLVLEVDMIKRKVIAHEGRHRAIVAKKLGIELVPVLIYTGSSFERVPYWDKKTHDIVDKSDFLPEK